MTGQITRTKRLVGGAIDVAEMKRKSWPGFAADFVRIAAPTDYEFRTTGSSWHVCLINLYRSEGETSAPDVPCSLAKDLRNKLTFAPPECAVSGWSRIEKPGTVTSIAIEQSEDGQWSDLEQLPPRIEFEDQMLRWVMLRLNALLTDPAHDTPGYAETLAEMLSFDLTRIALGAERRSPDCSGLSVNQVRLVVDYMESHLNEKTTISELAKLVDLTRFHFIRSFKQSVGVPPHQFMIQRRVERAKEMLIERGNSIADVAAGSGFNSSIQLSRAFRRVVGVTPSEFRRNAG